MNNIGPDQWLSLTTPMESMFADSTSDDVSLLEGNPLLSDIPTPPQGTPPSARNTFRLDSTAALPSAVDFASAMSMHSTQVPSHTQHVAQMHESALSGDLAALLAQGSSLFDDALSPSALLAPLYSQQQQQQQQQPQQQQQQQQQQQRQHQKQQEKQQQHEALSLHAPTVPPTIPALSSLHFTAVQPDMKRRKVTPVPTVTGSVAVGTVDSVGTAGDHVGGGHVAHRQSAALTAVPIDSDGSNNSVASSGTGRRSSRLKKKAEQARQARARKKAYIASLEEQKRKLTEQLRELKRGELQQTQSREQMAQRHKQAQQSALEALKSAQDQGEMAEHLRDFVENSRLRQDAVHYYVNRVAVALEPLHHSKWLLWALSQRRPEFFTSPTSVFRILLGKQVGLSQAQIDRVQRLRPHALNCWDTQKKLQRQLTEVAEEVQSAITTRYGHVDELMQSFSPRQVAAFVSALQGEHSEEHLQDRWEELSEYRQKPPTTDKTEPEALRRRLANNNNDAAEQQQQQQQQQQSEDDVSPGQAQEES
ncbi:MAG: hypothetical protein MHM6MM_002012 [Cercozoa sp. M6MM]